MAKKIYYLTNITEVDRMRVEIEIDKGKVKDFLVQQESYIGDKWIPVVRYNYSHGFPHKDILKSNGSYKKIKIKKIDLGKIVNDGVKDIRNNYEIYRKNIKDR